MPRLAPRAPTRPASTRHRAPVATATLRAVVTWYFALPAEARTGAASLPFYCDPAKIGAFAVDPAALALGDDAALFQLFVTLSMYQALRDVVIMEQQRSLPRSAMRAVADLGSVRRAVTKHACPVLRSADLFEQGCDVTKVGGVVDCGRCPGVPCLVKTGTTTFNRMGDMGKLPTSAWLTRWSGGGVRAVLAEICGEEPSPTRRAELLVHRFAKVHRVGRKLATMFVSALSTRALAPGLTPWFPEIDGNELVVIDTNVAQAVDTLRRRGAPKTYDARARWVREQAAQLDLREYHPDLPSYSPRLVQQALYAFCSKSNRVARGDACAARSTPCSSCAPSVCPFA